jgi:hypothetical protein
MTEQRRERLNEKFAQRRYAAALQAAAEELTELIGEPITGAEAMSKEATRAALDAAEGEAKHHLVWHRVWGVRLRDEMLETTGRLAAKLGGEGAVLVWRHSPPVGFVVPVAAALLHLPAYLGPPPEVMGSEIISSDVLLVAGDGESGLRLEYDHYAHADEYELRVWGRFAVSVSEPSPG